MDPSNFNGRRKMDLLSLIREDTGEPGSEINGHVDFYTCPICKTSDHSPFVYFPSAKAWECNCAMNESHLSKGGRVEYLQAARGFDAETACSLIEDKYADFRQAEEVKYGESALCDDGFPPITHAQTLNPPPMRPVLIEGLLRRGHKLLVTGRSKAGKSQLMLQLAAAVACGSRWLKFDVHPGRVLFVNTEVDPSSMENRLQLVAKGLDLPLERVQESVDFWHLRGYSQGIERTAAQLIKMVKPGDYSLIVLDSLYELYSGDENSAQDAIRFFHQVDRITSHSGASVAMTHHHAKGSRSGLAALDRGSGSGVFGRNPDAPIDLTEVFPPAGADSPLAPGSTAWRVSDSGLREFRSFEPFNLIFEHPLHRLDEEGVCDSWNYESPASKGGRNAARTNKRKAKTHAEAAEVLIRDSIVNSGAPLNLKQCRAICEDAGLPSDGRTVKKYIEQSPTLVLSSNGAGPGLSIGLAG